ncbi:MAG: ADP-forming succinate--CoA ligase subunit beta [Treponemataceae bacterium]
MQFHEYQVKDLFRKNGIKVLDGKPASTVEEAVEAAKSLPSSVWAVKAQVLAGGRGKAGGVKIAKSLDEVCSYASAMLGSKLVTAQTGAEGKLIRTVYIESGAEIAKEFYFSILVDRATEKCVIMASTEGGMEIETVAKEKPEAIVKTFVDPLAGLQAFQVNELSFALGLSKEEKKSFSKICTQLYKLFWETDASLLEINPLIETKAGEFLALDGKMSIDDNAVYRHPDLAAQVDLRDENPAELTAKEYGLSYISLDGNVGCMVNGAGLAMATMDLIKLKGGKPANFLDVGGGASAETVAKGFELILHNKEVKAIFVNIFGGIVRCDRVANGIMEAVKTIKAQVPIVVRLDGTNAKEAAEILSKANIGNLIVAHSFEDGAEKVTAAAREA